MPKMGFEKQILRPKYGNVPVDAVVNGRFCHFLSKLEYRWAQHLDLLRTVGEIKDFFYTFHTFYFDGGTPKEYTPDFLIRRNDNSFEYHETKGWVQKFDIDKLKRVFKERPYVDIVLIFWTKPKLSTQKRNKLVRYTKRIIWDARSILKNEPIDMN